MNKQIFFVFCKLHKQKNHIDVNTLYDGKRDVMEGSWKRGDAEGAERMLKKVNGSRKG